LEVGFRRGSICEGGESRLWGGASQLLHQNIPIQIIARVVFLFSSVASPLGKIQGLLKVTPTQPSCLDGHPLCGALLSRGHLEAGTVDAHRWGIEANELVNAPEKEELNEA
jgi:hypothetical protein